MHFITKLKSTRHSNKSTYCNNLFSGARIILPVMNCGIWQQAHRKRLK